MTSGYSGLVASCGDAAPSRRAAVAVIIMWLRCAAAAAAAAVDQIKAKWPSESGFGIWANIVYEQFALHLPLTSCHLPHAALAGLTEHAPMECGVENSCPHPCRCADGIVDCREKSLTSVPVTLPDDTTEL